MRIVHLLTSILLTHILLLKAFEPHFNLTLDLPERPRLGTVVYRGVCSGAVPDYFGPVFVQREEHAPTPPVNMLVIHPGFDEWCSYFLTIDDDRVINKGELISSESAYVSFELIRNAIIEASVALMNKLGNSESWVGRHIPELANCKLGDEAYNSAFGAGAFSFAEMNTYAQALMTDPANNILIVGDLHGSIHSLLRILTRLKLSGKLDDNFALHDKNFYMIFLGDYADYGMYGIEVWYTLLRLLKANPDNIILLRGNHETQAMRMLRELRRKYGDVPGRTIEAYLSSFCGLLPSVLFVATTGSLRHTDFIQCNHGGIEIAFDIKSLLNKARIDQKTSFQYLLAVSDDKIERLRRLALATIDPAALCFFESSGGLTSSRNGFLWNGFAKVENYFNDRTHGAINFSRSSARMWLENWFSDEYVSVHAMFHGHQHYQDTDIMANESAQFSGCNIVCEDGTWPCNQKGIDITGTTARLLGDDIYTLFSIPGTSNELSSTFRCDAFALIKTAELYSQWQVRLFEYDRVATLRPLMFT